MTTEIYNTITIIISVLALFANIGIAWYSINENRKLERENAGKNRTIYGIELINISKGIQDVKRSNVSKINEMLNSGKFSIIGLFEVSDSIETMILGKIQP